MITTESANHPPIAAPLRDLTTERLDLRRFRPDDLDELAIVFEIRSRCIYFVLEPQTRRKALAASSAWRGCFRSTARSSPDCLPPACD